MSSLNFQKLNPDDNISTITEKVNQNLSIISNNLEAIEGPSGEPGQVGFTGPRGRQGEKGDQGDKGSLWYRGNTLSDVPQNPREGDFFIITSTGEYYRYESGVWVVAGTLNFEDFGLMMIENQPKNSDYVDVTQENVLVIVNKMTNQTLLLSNFDRPNATGNVQIPDLDSPGETYPLIQGNDTDLNELYDYKLRIWNSGDAQDSAQRLEGRNIHIGNSFAMKTKEGWLSASGFTISSNLDPNNTTEDSSGTEILEITGISDGGTEHKHSVKVTDCDFYVGSFNVSKTGNVTIGFDSTYTAFQKFDVNGGILLGNTTINSIGSIRFSGGRFQGYRDNTNGWVNLDLSPDEVVQLVSANVTAFRDKLIDTSNTGGVIFGNASIGGSTYKKGTQRYNPDKDDMEFWSESKQKWISMGNQVVIGSGGTGTTGGSTGNGSGFEDQDGNPVASKIVIEVNTDAPADDPVYDGFVLTSDDESVTISQDLIDGKYAKIDISVNGGLTSGGGTDGNAAEKITGIDIISDDIEVKRTVEGGTATYKLALPSDSKTLQDAVNNLIDFRSPDNSIIALPPEEGKNYWQLSVKGGGGSAVEDVISNLTASGSPLGSIFKNAISRYKKTTGTVNLAYNSTYLGHIGYLPLDVKDFDENCYIVSTNPYELKVQGGMQGYYHIDSRVRFKITTAPSTFTSVRLVVLKNNVELLTLAQAKSTDFYTNSFSTSKEFELSGSDSVDLNCLTSDCDNSLKIALVVDFNSTTTGTGVVTLVDSNVTVNKVASVVTAQKVESQLANSNISFKTINIYDVNDVLDTILESSVYNANVTFKPTTYGNVYVESNNIYVGPNITAIYDYVKANINIDSGNYIYTGFKVVGNSNVLTTNATSSNISFEGGTDVDIVPYSSPAPKLKINVNKSKLAFYNTDGDLVGDSVFNGNVKAGENITFTLDSGNVIVDSSASSTGGKANIFASYVEYPSLTTIGLDEAEALMLKGLVGYNTVSKEENKIIMLPYSAGGLDTDNRIILNPSLGTFTDSLYPSTLVFKPNDTGKYEITFNAEFDVHQYSTNTNKAYFKQCMDRASVNFYLCQIYDGYNGDASIGYLKGYSNGTGAVWSNTNNSIYPFFKLGTSHVNIKAGPYTKIITFSSRMVRDLYSVSRTIVTELSNETKYGFGMNTGDKLGNITYLDFRGGYNNPRYTEYGNANGALDKNLKVILYNTNYIIKKID